MRDRVPTPVIGTCLAALLLAGCGADTRTAKADAQSRRSDQLRAVTLNEIVTPYALNVPAASLVAAKTSLPTIAAARRMTDTAIEELDSRSGDQRVAGSLVTARGEFAQLLTALELMEAAVQSGDAVQFRRATGLYGDAITALNAQLEDASIPPMFLLPRLVASPPA